MNSILSCGGLQRAFGLRLGGTRRLQGLAALIDDWIGDRLVWFRVRRAVEFALGKFRLGARIGELAVGLLATASNGRASMT